MHHVLRIVVELPRFLRDPARVVAHPPPLPVLAVGALGLREGGLVEEQHPDARRGVLPQSGFAERLAAAERATRGGVSAGMEREGALHAVDARDAAGREIDPGLGRRPRLAALRAEDDAAERLRSRRLLRLRVPDALVAAARLLDLGERVADVRVHRAAGEEEGAILSEPGEAGRVEPDTVRGEPEELQRVRVRGGRQLREATERVVHAVVALVRDLLRRRREERVFDGRDEEHAAHVLVASRPVRSIGAAPDDAAEDYARAAVRMERLEGVVGHGAESSIPWPAMQRPFVRLLRAAMALVIGRMTSSRF